MSNILLCAATLCALALLAGCKEKPAAPPPPPVAVKGDMELLVERGQRNPNDVETWFHIADLYERAQQYRQELEALRKVVAAKPDLGYAHYKMANTYNRLGLREEAIAAFLEAKKHLPKLPALYNNLGWTYGQVGRTKDQIAALRRAIELRSRYATARLSLGLVLHKQGDSKGAAEQLAALRSFDDGAAAELQKAIGGGRP